MRPLKAQPHDRFTGSGQFGPHWRYGEKEDDGQDPRPTIAWHAVIHDHASYRDLVALLL